MELTGNQSRIGILIGSLVFLAFAIYGTVSGETLVRHKISRVKEPTQYWIELAVEYACAILLFIAWLVVRNAQ